MNVRTYWRALTHERQQAMPASTGPAPIDRLQSTLVVAGLPSRDQASRLWLTRRLTRTTNRYGTRIPFSTCPSAKRMVTRLPVVLPSRAGMRVTVTV